MRKRDSVGRLKQRVWGVFDHDGKRHGARSKEEADSWRSSFDLSFAYAEGWLS